MASRPPVVVGQDGLLQQLQSGDLLSGAQGGINAKFTGSSTLPVVSLTTGGVLVLTVVPAAQGDSLSAGEAISVVPTTDLPGGLNIAWWRASDTNTVRIGLSVVSNLSLGSTVYAFRVTAHR